MPALGRTTDLLSTIPRSGHHKDPQPCRQVFDALTYALAEVDDPWLEQLILASVTSAPSSARLLITLASSRDDLDVDTALAHLLREEVAAEITRKRAPELVFRIAHRLRLPSTRGLADTAGSRTARNRRCAHDYASPCTRTSRSCATGFQSAARRSDLRFGIDETRVSTWRRRADRASAPLVGRTSRFQARSHARRSRHEAWSERADDPPRFAWPKPS